MNRMLAGLLAVAALSALLLTDGISFTQSGEAQAQAQDEAEQMAQAPTPDWQFIPIDQARLQVDPSAFGTRGIRISTVEDAAARYERWTNGFDTSRRFFQFMLRESQAHTVVAAHPDIERFVVGSLGGHAAGQVAWDDGDTMAMALGEAEYRRFQFLGYGCAGFKVSFGGRRGGYPIGVLEGFYCDPAVPRLSGFDVRNTLDAIRLAP